MISPIVNNTFYDYMNRYNQTEDYYADTAKGSFTIENKTDFKVKFATGSVNHDVDAGFTYRYAHVLDIQNFVNEPVSIFDLSAKLQHLGVPGGAAGTGRCIPLQRSLQSFAMGTAGTFSGAPGPGRISGRRVSERHRRFESEGRRDFPRASHSVFAAVERAVWPARRRRAAGLFRPARGCGLRRSSGTESIATKCIHRLVWSV